MESTTEQKISDLTPEQREALTKLGEAKSWGEFVATAATIYRGKPTVPKKRRPVGRPVNEVRRAAKEAEKAARRLAWEERLKKWDKARAEFRQAQEAARAERVKRRERAQEVKDRIQAERAQRRAARERALAEKARLSPEERQRRRDQTRLGRKYGRPLSEDALTFLLDKEATIRQARLWVMQAELELSPITDQLRELYQDLWPAGGVSTKYPIGEGFHAGKAEFDRLESECHRRGKQIKQVKAAIRDARKQMALHAAGLSG